jgi:hypothetical protein
VKVISGKLSRPAQVAFTVIPSVSSSITAFGPTKSEVPESITPLYLETSITLFPYLTESSFKAQYLSSTTLCF